MARKRQVDPCYPFEKEIRALSRDARYFYLLSWCHMSDPNPKEKTIGGVLPYDAFYLKNNIFPEETIEIAPLINEIVAQRRYFLFKAQGKDWIWCPTMAKHQNVQHPSKAKYPDPPPELVEKYNNHIPLNEPSMSPHIPLTQSRVELSRVEKETEPSAALKAALDKVLKRGFNIYSLINKLKKSMDLPKEWQFPEEVLLRVCAQYEKDRTKIRALYPWFLKVIAEETRLWFTNQQIKANVKDRGMAPSLKEILKGIK